MKQGSKTNFTGSFNQLFFFSFAGKRKGTLTGEGENFFLLGNDGRVRSYVEGVDLCYLYSSMMCSKRSELLEVLASEECLPETLHAWLSNKRKKRGRLDGCSEGTQGAENKVYHLLEDGQKHI